MSARHWLASLVAASCLTLASCTAAIEPDTGPTADLYHGFTLLDPESRRVVRDAYVVVAGNRITEVGAGTRDGGEAVRAIDMRGHYALPGFIDGHAHITSGPHSIEVVDGAPQVSIPSIDKITQHNAAVALAFGVTTVRNPGGDPEANARYDVRRDDGSWAGPEALHAGAVIQPPPFGGAAFAYPRTEAEWHAEARRQAELGMRYFKLYTGLRVDELEAGIRAARANGLKPIAHLDAVSWTVAAKLGIHGIEHTLPTSADLLEPKQRAVYMAERGVDARHLFRWFELADFDGPLIREMLAELAGRSVVVSTTLVVNELVYNSDRLDVVLPAGDRTYTHPDNLRALLAFLPTMEEEDHRRARAVMPKVLEFVRRLHGAGVPILVGTDGNGGGPAYSRELALHVDAGIDTWEVLNMATTRAAELVGIDGRTGRVSAGMEADIVFLRTNPLTDIRNVREVGLVVSDGRAYEPDTLLAELEPEDSLAEP